MANNFIVNKDLSQSKDRPKKQCTVNISNFLIFYYIIYIVNTFILEDRTIHCLHLGTSSMHMININLH